MDSSPKPSLGLLGATGVGVGAIVGGGVLALAGVAFAATGPAALLAFALNGIIALLTALSFAEMASAFPESGGAYTFAKKVLSVEAAFMVGWVIWMASIVAGVLYALGFASYTVIAVDQVWKSWAGEPPAWLSTRGFLVVLALAAVLFYSVVLVRKAAGGRQWATVGKVVVFVVLILCGFWVLAGVPGENLARRLAPFFPGGHLGLFQAMGYTFIALQGFDLIAAVGGETRDPRRTIPRAMLLSLAAALAIYLPLLFVIITVGVEPGESIAGLGSRHPATVIAVAVRRFLGIPGFWFVIVAAVLSMLSALRANLFAASRIAQAMSRDRTLPGVLGRTDRRTGSPVVSVVTTGLVLAVIVILFGDVAAAGAAASLIFLVSFALAHWIHILWRWRGGMSEGGFRSPWFPAVPLTGGACCVALALFQGITVPAAGLLGVIWLGAGGLLYFSLFARRARVVDASAEALDPDLVRYRGRAPLVLVPIARPASTRGLVEVASALAPPGTGRVLLLSVVQPPGQWDRGGAGDQIADVQTAMARALTTSFDADLAPEWLTTVAPTPWPEIARVARTHRCETLLLGLGDLSDRSMERRLEELMENVDSDVVVLRAPEDWRLARVSRVLVPAGGRRDQSPLRARLLGSLVRTGGRRISFVRVVSPSAAGEEVRRARRELFALARDEAPGRSRSRILREDDVTGTLVQHSSGSDLVILGMVRRGRRKVFGDLTLALARETSCPMILIGHRGSWKEGVTGR
jgi:amino acid transporter